MSWKSVSIFVFTFVVFLSTPSEANHPLLANVNGPAAAVFVWSGCLWTKDGAVWNPCLTNACTARRRSFLQSSFCNFDYTGMSRVAFSDKLEMWLAVGTTTIATSRNGVEWDPLEISLQSLSVAWANNAFYFTTLDASSVLKLAATYDGSYPGWTFSMAAFSPDTQIVSDPIANRVLFIGSSSNSSNFVLGFASTANTDQNDPPTSGISIITNSILPPCSVREGLQSAILVGRELKFSFVCMNADVYVMSYGLETNAVSTSRLASNSATSLKRTTLANGKDANYYIFCQNNNCLLLKNNAPNADSIFGDFDLPQTTDPLAMRYSSFLDRFFFSSANGTSGNVGSFLPDRTAFSIATTADFADNLNGVDFGTRTFGYIAPASGLVAGTYKSAVISVPLQTTPGLVVQTENDFAINAPFQIVPGSTVEVGSVAWVNSATDVSGTILANRLIVGTKALMTVENGGVIETETASVSSDSTLVVGPGGKTEFFVTECQPGSVTEISLQGNASLGNLVARAGSTLRVVGTTAPESNTTKTATFVIARLNQDSESPLFANTLFSVSSGSPCTIASPNGVSFAQSALTVTVSFNQIPNCGGVPPAFSPTTTASDGGLSTAALIGICVGATVGGIAIILAIVGVIYKAHQERQSMKTIQAKLQQSAAITSD